MAKAIFNVTFTVKGDEPLTPTEIDGWKKDLIRDLNLRGWHNFTVEYQEDEDGKDFRQS